LHQAFDRYLPSVFADFYQLYLWTGRQKPSAGHHDINAVVFHEVAFFNILASLCDVCHGCCLLSFSSVLMIKHGADNVNAKTQQTSYNQILDFLWLLTQNVGLLSYVLLI